MRRRQRAGFVAREEQLAWFRANLARPVEDPDRCFVFCVHGDGGVGKTSLLRQLRRIAEEHGAATAYLDETVFAAAEAMRAIAGDLSRQGEKLPGFSKVYDTYLQHRHDVETDPGAPAGVAGYMTRAAVTVGVHAARAVPGIGGLAAGVDPAALAEQAERLRVFLSGKFARHEEVRMLLSPLEVLTPVFVRDLAAVGRHRPLALFFDTYERTGPVLDEWLRALLDGAYGELPQDLVVTLAGRRAVDRGRWAPYLGVMAEVPLSPFTEAEARHLLARAGITDERVIEVILTVSGRLPLLVAMLAQNQPTDPDAVGDPSGDAVERFLAWEINPECRALALTGAVPRVLDEDVLGALLDLTGEDDEPGSSFAWIRAQSFVTHEAGRCQYHDVVRAAMLRIMRRQSPTRWRQRHHRLAATHRTWRLAISEHDDWDDAAWRIHKLEETYHLLCAEQAKALSSTLIEVIYACTDSKATAARWSQMITQAGDDTDSDTLRAWGRQLGRSLQGDEHDARIVCLSLLLTHPDLTDAARAIALRTRGLARFTRCPEDEILADFDRALELAPNDAQAMAYRGNALRWHGRPEEALADLECALALAPTNNQALAARGDAYRQLGRCEESLADLDRAIAADPAYVFALGARGATYLVIGRYEQALIDLSHALDLDPTNFRRLTTRGRTYLAMGRYPQALADLDRALELNPAHVWALAKRASTYRMLGRYEEALADASRAIELDPAHDWFWYTRALVLMCQGQPGEAAAHVTKAVELAHVVIASGTHQRHSALNLVTYRACQGDYEQARQTAARTLGRTPNPYQLHEIVQDLRELSRVPGIDSTEVHRFIAALDGTNPHSTLVPHAPPEPRIPK